MKRLLGLLSIVLLIGCGSIQVSPDQELILETTAEILVRNIACQISKIENEEIDRSIRNIYQLVRDRELTDDALKQLSELISDYPTLAADIQSLINLFGATVVGDQIEFQILTESFYAKIEKAYLQGIMLCKGD